MSDENMLMLDCSDLTHEQVDRIIKWHSKALTAYKKELLSKAIPVAALRVKDKEFESTLSDQEVLNEFGRFLDKEIAFLKQRKKEIFGD